MVTFALIHSPLVGPYAWTAIAECLRDAGHDAVVPDLHAQAPEAIYFWLAHAKAVAHALYEARADGPLVLVGWSGAGVLLPVVAAHLARDVGAYIFVDADIPQNGKSRLDLFASDREREQFRALARDGYLPVWPDAMLEALIPDAAVRAAFVGELRPCPLAVYEEPIPVFADWPDAPCAYLRFSDSYDAGAAAAADRGWPVQRLPGTHFHLMNEPKAVAQALLELTAVVLPAA